MNQTNSLASVSSPLFKRGMLLVILLTMNGCPRIEQVETVLIGGRYRLTVDHKLNEAVIGISENVIEPVPEKSVGFGTLTISGLQRTGSYLLGQVVNTGDRKVAYYFIINTASSSHLSGLDYATFVSRLSSENVVPPAAFEPPEDIIDRLSPPM